MSILIKGMEMPPNCWDCRVETLTGQCPCNIGIAEASDYRDRRHEDCPIKEAPTPHGRLIDADEYEKRIKPYDTEDVLDKALYNFAHGKLIETSTAEPRKGKWVQRPGGYICIYMCSECGAVGHRTAFCPHCGARMEESDV